MDNKLTISLEYKVDRLYELNIDVLIFGFNKDNSDLDLLKYYPDFTEKAKDYGMVNYAYIDHDPGIYTLYAKIESADELNSFLDFISEFNEMNFTLNVTQLPAKQT